MTNSHAIFSTKGRLGFEKLPDCEWEVNALEPNSRCIFNDNPA